MCVFCVCPRQVKQGDADGAKVSLVALEDKVALLIKFLGNNEDDVSGTVAEFSHSYIGVLKQLAPITCRQKETIKVKVTCMVLAILLLALQTCLCGFDAFLLLAD